MILDQFELEPSPFYSGSYTSETFLGDIITNNETSRLGYSPIGAGFSNVRKLVSNKTDKNPTDFIDNSWIPGWLTEGLASSSFIGTHEKFVRMFSDRERYADTIVPNPIEIHQANGAFLYVLNNYSLTTFNAEFSGSAWGIDPFPTGGLAIIMERFPKTTNLGGTPTSGLSDRHWIFQFPFQSTFKNVEKITKFSVKFQNHYSLTANVNDAEASPVSHSNHLVSILVNGPSTTIVPVGTMKHPQTFWSPSLSIFNNEIGTVPARELFNIYFGIGDGDIMGAGTGTQTKGVNLKLTSGSLETNEQHSVFYSYASQLRGYKYGLKSALPEKSSAVFRVSKFGQVRDMLEQRIFTKSYDTALNQLDKQGPVTVRFVSGTETFSRAKVYLTATNPDFNPKDSGIFDYEAKSGQPFFDDVDLTQFR